jgi:hypothetical protein
MGVRKYLLAAALAVTAGIGLTASPVQAATQSPYPNALVEYMASTRTLPYVRNDTYWGYALRQSSGSGAPRQTVAVGCWWNGDWATGTYYTNRWFLVLVWESYDGYNVPRWLFVHASYVYNQPSVPQCVQSPTGIWLP